MNLKSISSTSPGALKITLDLFNDLEVRYGKGSIESFEEENGKFLLFLAINIEGKIAACGALNHIDEKTAEIKRMFVYPEHRGKGLSKIILSALEKEAADKHYKKIILETGVMQPEAIALYEKYNYKRRPCYGRFEGDLHSVCFEKLIDIFLILFSFLMFCRD